MKKIAKMFKGINNFELSTTYFILFDDNLKISFKINDMDEQVLDSLRTNTNEKLKKCVEEFKVLDNYPVKIKLYPKLEHYRIWEVVKVFRIIHNECKDYHLTLYVFDSLMMFRERMKRGIYNDNDWQY